MAHFLKEELTCDNTICQWDDMVCKAYPRMH